MTKLEPERTDRLRSTQKKSATLWRYVQCHEKFAQPADSTSDFDTDVDAEIFGHIKTELTKPVAQPLSGRGFTTEASLGGFCPQYVFTDIIDSSTAWDISILIYV